MEKYINTKEQAEDKWVKIGRDIEFELSENKIF